MVAPRLWMMDPPAADTVVVGPAVSTSITRIEVRSSVLDVVVLVVCIEREEEEGVERERETEREREWLHGTRTVVMGRGLLDQSLLSPYCLR